MNLLTDGMGGESCDSLISIDWTKAISIKTFSTSIPSKLTFAIESSSKTFGVSEVKNSFSINSTKNIFTIQPQKIVFKLT